MSCLFLPLHSLFDQISIDHQTGHLLFLFLVSHVAMDAVTGTLEQEVCSARLDFSAVVDLDTIHVVLCVLVGANLGHLEGSDH